MLNNIGALLRWWHDRAIVQRVLKRTAIGPETLRQQRPALTTTQGICDMAEMAHTPESEIWKPVLGYSNLYEVSSWGRVRNRKSQTLKKLSDPRPGWYTAVSLQNNGRTQSVNVHRLVCAAFHGPAGEGQKVRHLDGDRFNNHANNMAWGSHSQNMLDRTAHGRAASKRAGYELAEKVRLEASQGIRAEDLAEHHGISITTVWRILRNQSWTSTDGLKRPGRSRKEINFVRWLSEFLESGRSPGDLGFEEIREMLTSLTKVQTG